jgi:hypothetical protein
MYGRKDLASGRGSLSFRRELLVTPFTVALAGLLCTMLLCALYWHWRVYSLYRSLDEVKHKFVYSEFSFQFQSPWFARQLRGPMFRDELSPEEEMQVAAVSRQLRPAMIVVGCCVAIMFVWIVGGVFAGMRVR